MGPGSVDERPSQETVVGDVRLEVDALTSHGVFSDISFTLRAGERPCVSLGWNRPGPSDPFDSRRNLWPVLAQDDRVVSTHDASPRQAGAFDLFLHVYFFY